VVRGVARGAMASPKIGYASRRIQRPRIGIPLINRCSEASIRTSKAQRRRDRLGAGDLC